MDDWLAELRESKQQMIEREETESAPGPVPQATTEAQLQSREKAIGALVQAVEVEPLLRQFATEILQGHPLFSNTALMRTVYSKAAGSSIELTEPAPWSAPVEENPLPDSLGLGNGHSVVSITWRLQSNYAGLHHYEYQPFRVRVSVSANEVLVDGQPLDPPTADTLKTRLTTTFKQALEQLSQRRIRHRRHRPWYRRIWRVLFPETNLTTALLVTVAVVLVLAILIAFFGGPAFAGVRR